MSVWKYIFVSCRSVMCQPIFHLSMLLCSCYALGHWHMYVWHHNRVLTSYNVPYNYHILKKDQVRERMRFRWEHDFRKRICWECDFRKIVLVFMTKFAYDLFRYGVSHCNWISYMAHLRILYTPFPHTKLYNCIHQWIW